MTTRAQVVSKQIKDQVIGSTARAGVKPSTVGIARKRMIANAAKRAVDAADAIASIVAARDSGDDEAKRLARLLIDNPEFMRAMSQTLSSIQAELKAASSNGTQPNSNIQPASADPDPSNPEGIYGGADNPESPSPNNNPHPEKGKGSGLPGTDARQAPGSYSKAHLIRDLATQNGAAARLSLRVGTDAANARVASDPLVPAWDSPVWSAEARDYFQARTSYDGWAAQHIGTCEPIARHFADDPEPTQQPHPRSFDR